MFELILYHHIMVRLTSIKYVIYYWQIWVEYQRFMENDCVLVKLPTELSWTVMFWVSNQCMQYVLLSHIDILPLFLYCLISELYSNLDIPRWNPRRIFGEIVDILSSCWVFCFDSAFCCVGIFLCLFWCRKNSDGTPNYTATQKE